MYSCFSYYLQQVPTVSGAVSFMVRDVMDMATKFNQVCREYTIPSLSLSLSHAFIFC